MSPRSHGLRKFLIVCAFGTATAFPQTSRTTEIQQLKEKLQQLEQTVQELKSQLAAVEQAQKPPAPPQPAPPRPAPPREAAAAPAPLPAWPRSEEYLGNETRDRNSAGQNEFGAPRIDNAPMDPEMRGYFRLPGTGTLMRFGGFVKSDFFYDFHFPGTYYGAYVPSSFPAVPTPDSSDSTVSMRPSRFFVEWRQPIESGGNSPTLDTNKSVKAYMELDWLSNYDRNTPRLRQFYAQYRNILVGQAWSAFSDPDAFPDTLEFEGPPGIIGLRNPQFRYTYPLNKHHSIGASIEKSGTDVPFATQFGTPRGTSLRPDMIAFYHLEEHWGHIHAAGISRSVGGIIQSGEAPNLDNHKEGYGLSFSGAWGLGAQRDSVVWQGVVGRGISNYYNDNFGLGTDVGFNAEGRLEATPTWSAEAGYSHYWSKLVRSTFSYGYLRINNAAQDPGTTYHTSQYATANIIVQPTVRFLFGGEYIYGSARRKDGFIWVVPRIQLSLTYYLNKYAPPKR